MKFSELTAKDMIIGGGFLLLMFLSSDWYDNLKNTLNSKSTQDSATLNALKDLTVGVVKVQGDVGHIKENTEKSFNLLDEKINYMAEELKETKNSVQSSLREANQRVYMLEQEIRNIDSRLKLVEFRQKENDKIN